MSKFIKPDNKCKPCIYYNKSKQHHDCDAKRLDGEHYTNCVFVQYASYYDNVLIKKKKTKTEELYQSITQALKNVAKKLKRKPIAPPMFKIGDIVQAGTVGVKGVVVCVKWVAYSKQYTYSINTERGRVEKAEYVLNKIR